jgi:3-phosphoshikimate 1-carboxyvinyltransferase
VIEPAPTRDHTELLLASGGVPVVRRPRSVSVDGVERLRVGRVEVPGDFSAAAPLFVGALLLPGSQVTLLGVGLNPRRVGLLDVLARMGAPINDLNKRRLGRELVGDLDVVPTRLVAADIGATEVPRLVDELPLAGLAAAMAHGRTVVRGAGELRLKESDRLGGTVAALRSLGARAEEREDGYTVTGVPTRLRGGRVHAQADHRLAILGGVAGLVSREGVDVSDPDVVDVSFPGFWDLIDSVALRG